MPRVRATPRPPLPPFAVAWFPAFRGIERIEAFRARHDPMAGLVPAHLSLVFPFPTALSRLQETHVRRVASRWPPIPVSRAAFDAAREQFRDELGDVIRAVTLLSVGRHGRIRRLSEIPLHSA